MDPELQKNLKRLVKLTLIVLLLVGIYLLLELVFPVVSKLLKSLPGLVLPFLFAIIIAIVMEPIVSFFTHKTHFKRGLATLVALLTVLGAVFLVFYVIVSVVIRELSSIYQMALPYSEQYIYQFMGWIADWRVFLLTSEMPAEVLAAIQDNLTKATGLLEDTISTVLNWLMQLGAALPNILIFLMIVIVASYFIIKDRKMITAFVLRCFPEHSRSTVYDIASNLLRKLFGFLRAYLILVSITAILSMVGLKILGAENVLTLGLLIGIADILPVLGPGLIYVPWILWCFLSGRIGMGIGLLVLYAFLSITRQFLEPKIVGDNIGLHPLATLISLYVGLRLGGVVGLFLGPICIVIFVALYEEGLLDRFDWRKAR